MNQLALKVYFPEENYSSIRAFFFRGPCQDAYFFHTSKRGSDWFA